MRRDQLPTSPTPVRRSGIIGSIFLMATAAIGPAFITQTAAFTAQLGAAFAFAILISIVIDIAIQTNVWRVLVLARSYVQDLLNNVRPGMGTMLAVLVVLGAVIFNIGNLAGTGLGLNALLGVDPRIGAPLSAALAIGIFLTRKAGIAIDWIVVCLGTVLLSLALYVAFVSSPPVGQALTQSVVPDNIDFLAITTIIGATVGGYVTYSGAHRLLDAGYSGPEHLRRATHTSIWAIVVIGAMRIVLFLAILGVATSGVTLAADDPAGSAFQHAAGEVGLRLFGLALWAAGISSVIAAAYTSISFLKSIFRPVRRAEQASTCVFIAVTAALFLAIQQPPVALLIFAGAVNGFILPVGFGAILWTAARRSDLLDVARYPRWLLVIGVIAWAFTVTICYFSVHDLVGLFGKLG